jgi:hypothetical protein
MSSLVGKNVVFYKFTIVKILKSLLTMARSIVKNVLVMWFLGVG